MGISVLLKLTVLEKGGGGSVKQLDEYVQVHKWESI